MLKSRVTETEFFLENSVSLCALFLIRSSELSTAFGEKGAGSRILLSCVIGLTEPLGGQTPCSRVSARIRRRSSKLLYAHR